MAIYGLGQLAQVAAVDEVGSAPRPQAVVQPAVIGLAPIATPAPDKGLAAPNPGVSAARPAIVRVAADDKDAELMKLARAHFVRERPETVTVLQRAFPDLATSVVDEIADEWVARSLRRYGARLGGRNDGLESLTPSGLLLAIAHEGRRPAEDPVRVVAEAHRARLIELFSGRSMPAEQASFHLHTVGGLVSHITEGWEAELQRK